MQTLEIKPIDEWMAENVNLTKKKKQIIIQGNIPENWYDDVKEFDEEEE